MADLIDINLDEVESWGEPLVEGIYPVKVTSATWKKKEGGEFPYIAAELSPTDGKNDSRRLFLNLSTHPKALGNMKAFFQATRMPGGKLRANDPEITQMLTGRECKVSVGIEEGPNGKRNVVRPPYHIA